MTLRTVLLSLQALLAAAEPDDPQDAVVANQVRICIRYRRSCFSCGGGVCVLGAVGFCGAELYLRSLLSASPVQAEPRNVQTDRSIVVSHLCRCSHL